MTRPPRTYELMTILAPDVPEDQIGPAVEQIQGYITGAGGAIAEVLQDSPWGRRRLAYPIRHNGHDVRDGYYTVFHFDLEPARVADIEREILLNSQIIRYLVTVYTAPAPSPAGEEAGEAAEAAGPAAEAEQAPAAAAEGAQEAAPEAAGAPAVEASAEAETAENGGEASAASADADSVAETTSADTGDEQAEAEA
jgi:small subunit ribosomal protein S6